MPENETPPPNLSTTPLKTTTNNLNGTIFGQRRVDILRNLQQSAEQLKFNYNGRKELASEKDEIVAELCESLEDCFSYGIRQQNATIQITAASIFQNMQEIVSWGSSSSASTITNGNSNETTFWDFCQMHLTSHERERFENLNHIWTKYGRGRAFIRAALNEKSLHRYLLTWLSSEGELHRYFTPWSLLMDEDAAKEILKIIESLNDILFALTIDTTELNVRSTRTISAATIAREEPIIYAPTPAPPRALLTSKKKTNIVERPIATPNSKEDILSDRSEMPNSSGGILTINHSQQSINGCLEEIAAQMIFNRTTPTDNIEPELEFLKTPLPEFTPEVHLEFNNENTNSTASNCSEQQQQGNEEDKSDTSSQYSNKSSLVATSNATNEALEQKLREMTEKCELLETRVAKLSLENRQLIRRLKKQFEDTGIDPSSSTATNFLITIPQVKLLKSKRGSPYYVYEIHITMRNLEHWAVLRRYREFYKLHKSLLRTHPSIANVEFPPKKHFGNMNLVFVEERRQQLQIYLLNLVESLPQVEACKTKIELQKIFPFLRGEER